MDRISFASDLDFLKANTNVVELACSQQSQIVVVPEFQGRVMTSTLDGPQGASYGWLNRRFIEKGVDDPLFNNYGGEDRIWLGPEAGQFALFFKSGQPFDTDHWDSPKGLTAKPFEVTAQDERSVTMSSVFDVTNYSLAEFHCRIDRKISILDTAQTALILGASIPQGVGSVGFESDNTLTNTGPNAWSPDRGMVCLWILGMMKALKNGKAIVPFKSGDESELGPKAKMDYFGQLPPDRGYVGENYAWFKVDGMARGKIGVGPKRAGDMLGSYDFDNNQLTIIQFSLPKDAGELPYPNSAWEIQDAPQGGDAINSYNDPGDEDGEPTFFELESSSPSARLDSDQNINHVHRTFHFEGEFDTLNELSINTLGIDLNNLT
ncbi:MAG: hypothetical protein HN350_14205 [Phycisphaerales bacterium]|nr:hypothetical protein [Phycisphaerales bacterium]